MGMPVSAASSSQIIKNFVHSSRVYVSSVAVMAFANKHHVKQASISRQARPSCQIAFRRPHCVCHAHSNASEQSSSVSMQVSRRAASLGLVSVVLGSAMTIPGPANAVGFKKELKKKKLSPEDYTEDADTGLKIYELEEGRSGDVIQAGDRVVVHFDCIYRGLDVVSSRSARLLGGNRTIAEPYEYVVGEPVAGQQLKKINEGANGLFTGSSGPKPPQALSRATLGMKKGGKRSILVDQPELGYPKGVQEIPPGATFELKVEVLEVYRKSA